MPDLIVAGLVIPLEVLGEHSQSYELSGGRSRLRMMDGSQHAQTRWAKLATTLRASGWAPSGLHGLDPSIAVTLACVAPRAIAGAGNVIALPAARRIDAPPVGLALVGGRLVPTALALVGDVATLDAVPGASGYRALYWPLITAYVEISEEVDVAAASFGWTLTAEEA